MQDGNGRQRQPHLCNLAGGAIAVVVPVHSGNLAPAIHIAGNALHANMADQRVVFRPFNAGCMAVAWNA